MRSLSNGLTRDGRSGEPRPLTLEIPEREVRPEAHVREPLVVKVVAGLWKLCHEVLTGNVNACDILGFMKLGRTCCARHNSGEE